MYVRGLVMPIFGGLLWNLLGFIQSYMYVRYIGFLRDPQNVTVECY